MEFSILSPVAFHGSNPWLRVFVRGEGRPAPFDSTSEGSWQPALPRVAGTETVHSRPNYSNHILDEARCLLYPRGIFRRMPAAISQVKSLPESRFLSLVENSQLLEG